MAKRAWARWRSCGSNTSHWLRPPWRALNMATRASRSSSAAMVCGLVHRAMPAQPLMEMGEFSRRKGSRERRQKRLGEGLRLPHQRGVKQDGELVGSHARQKSRGVDGGFRDHAAEAGRGFDQQLDRPRGDPGCRSSFESRPDRATTTATDFPGRWPARVSSRWLKNMVRLPSPVSGSSRRLSRSACERRSCV